MVITGSPFLPCSVLRSSSSSSSQVFPEINSSAEVEIRDQAINFNNRSKRSNNASGECQYSTVNVQINDFPQSSLEVNRLSSFINQASIYASGNIQSTDLHHGQVDNVEAITDAFQSLQIRHQPEAVTAPSQREISFSADEQIRKILPNKALDLLEEIKLSINNAGKFIKAIENLLGYGVGIRIFYKINDVGSLVNFLKNPSDNIHKNEIKVLWTLADKMVCAFLKYNFISTSSINEILELKSLMQEQLWENVENKFQEMIDFTIGKINAYWKNKNDGQDIFFLLENLYVLVKYIKNFNKKENNLLKIIINLSSVIQYIPSKEERFRRKLNVLVSKILNEISVHDYKYNFHLSEFELPLQRLYVHFSYLENNSDYYINYLANYTCQSLINIYKFSYFINDGANSSELSKSQQSDWYVKLREYYKIVNEGEIKKIKFSDLKYFLDKLTNLEKKLFLGGLYENLIHNLFGIKLKNCTRQQVFELLDKIINEYPALMAKQSFIRNIKLPAEESFFWVSALPEINQRVELNNWLKKISNERKSQSEFLASLKGLLLNSIFTVPLKFNYLIKHAKRKIIKKVRQKVYPFLKLGDLDFRSSPFRHLRYMRTAMDNIPSYRNTASMKYVDENGKAFYLMAHSMGNPQGGKIILPRRFVVGDDNCSDRGHSEAVLLAAHAIGHIKVKGWGTLNLAGLKQEYCASTNEPCSTGEACKLSLLPSLPTIFYANSYKGHEDANGFMDKLHAHQWRKNEDESYESEVESEEECEVFVLDGEYFKGLDLTHEQEREPVPAWRLRDHIKEKSPYYSEPLENSFENKYFSGYVNIHKNSYKAPLIGKNERIVKLGIKTESEVDELDSEVDLTAAVDTFCEISEQLKILLSKLKSLRNEALQYSGEITKI